MVDIRLPHILLIGFSTAEGDELVHRCAELGFDAGSASNGGMGLAMAKNKTPDLVLVHASSTDPGPLEVIQKLKKDEDTDVIPIIAMIPTGQMEQIEQYLQAGAEDYLMCPYSPTMLKVMTHDFIEISRKRQDERNHMRQVAFFKIEHDVQVARDIQLNFLPSSLPSPNGWGVAAYFHPARQVAGDWYDAFYLSSRRRVGFVVADVCDKGVGSALFMALLRSLIRAFAQQNLSLQWIDADSDDWLSTSAATRRKSAPSAGTMALRNAITITNNYMFENHGQMNYFATMFFGIFDPANGTVTYVNAGHPPAIVMNAQGGVKERLMPTAPAVGLFPDTDFKIGETCLNPGETLLAFSDGVTDARAPNNKMFSEKRLLALCEAEPVSAQMLLDKIQKELYDHIDTADQFDDITMMAVMRSPEKKA